MTTIHSILINSNPLLQAGRNVRATRTSKSRQYAACLVATVTLSTVERVAQALIEHEAVVADLTPILEGLLATWGWKDHAEVEAIHQAAKKPWFDALFAAEQAFRDSKGPNHYSMTAADRKAVQAQIIAQGHVDPYAQKEHTFLELARKLENAQRGAAHIKEQDLKVGQQFVLSWHKNVSNAQKALGSASVDYYRGRGYSVEIRTDIEVTTK